MLEFIDFCGGYGKKDVLCDLSLALPNASLTCVIGENGCGKSTLLKGALGLLPSCRGTVLIDGAPLAQMKRRDVAVRLSYLPQERKMPDMTVLQTVLNGRFPHVKYPYRYSKKDKEIAWDAMRRMKVDALAEAFLSELSGGLRQKVYIAMALAQETDHILLDEPTAHLDVGHTIALMRELRALAASGKAVIAVLHDLPLALEYADRIIALHEGQLVFDGAPRELLKTDLPMRIFGASVQTVQAEGKTFYHMDVM